MVLRQGKSSGTLFLVEIVAMKQKKADITLFELLAPHRSCCSWQRAIFPIVKPAGVGLVELKELGRKNLRLHTERH